MNICENCGGDDLRVDACQEVTCQSCGLCWMENLSTEYHPNFDGFDICYSNFRKKYDCIDYVKRTINCKFGLQTVRFQKRKLFETALCEHQDWIGVVFDEQDMRNWMKRHGLQAYYKDALYIYNYYINPEQCIKNTPPIELREDIIRLFKRFTQIYYQEFHCRNKKKMLPIQFVIKRLLAYIKCHYLTHYEITDDLIECFRSISSSKIHANEDILSDILDVMELRHQDDLAYEFF